MGLALVLPAFIAIALTGCGQRAQEPVNKSGDTAAEALADYYVREKAGVAPDRVPAATRDRLREDFKRLQAAAIVGERNLKPEVASAIELARLEILARSAAEAAGVYATPSDAELQQAYQYYLQSLSASEYHVSHILVATENAAAIVITKLQGGAEFAAIARSDSADESKSQGGDLGWIVPGKLPAPFTDAVQSLKPGEFTQRPVRTPYGWHVIKLMETRAAAAPPFEQVKAQLATNLQQERYRTFLDESLKGAK